MTGANSAAGLRSTPARYLFLDEVDAYPADADGEGDPVDLAVKRTATYRGKRKILMVSTPTLKHASRIEKAFDESDQRRFFVPCPHCAEPHTLEWENVAADGSMTCPSCGGQIDEAHKPAMLAGGAWRATAPGDGRTAGFHLSSLYSPFEPWADLVAAHEKVRQDPTRLQVWWNTTLGRTWEDQGAQALDPEGLSARRESWGDALPEGVAVVTAGVDVQGDRIEVQFVGWGRDEEAWILDYRVIWGDPSGPAIWHDLDALLMRGFRHAKAVPDLPVRAACVDTGGAHTATSYDFVRRRLSRRIWGIKGASQPHALPWPKRITKGKGGAPIAVIGVNALKDKLASRIAVAEPGAGFIHFPAALDRTYFDQLAAEHVVTKYVNNLPVRSWQKRRPGDANEAFDTLVYATAALHGLAAAGMRLEDEADRIAAAPLRGVPAPAAPAAPVVIRSKWLDR
jgi:phage terminase large subunit GpA-like protein